MTEASVAVAGLAAVGALAAAATALSRPLLSLGILFLLASISRATLETPIGTMRLEQPAIALVAAVLLVRGRFGVLRHVPRVTVAMAVAFGIYLGVEALSSAFVAPHPISSLRLVAWTAVSMLGGVVAFVLAKREPTDVIEPLAFGGAATGAVGIAVAVTFLVVGPPFDLGVQEANGIMPRVYGYSWEANLYASFLALCTPFALEAARGPRKAAGLAMLALILVALPLGGTRGAYLGLAAGLITYVGARVVLERGFGDLRRLGPLAAAGFFIGIVASTVLLPNLVERLAAARGPGSTPAVSAGPTSASSPGPNGSGSPSLVPSPTPVPIPSLQPYPDTLAFRLERVPVALDDLRQSPLIGLGAESFGQRHVDPSQPGMPDHIAILAVAVLYDSGALGAIAISIGFGLLLWSLWSSARRPSGGTGGRSVGATGAFMASLVTMLVAYEATNALHFAINWIIIGAAAALSAREDQRPSAARYA